MQNCAQYWISFQAAPSGNLWLLFKIAFEFEIFFCFKGILFLPANQVDSIYILHSMTVPTAKLRKLAVLF